MKIGVIGDLHGKHVWKHFVDNHPEVDKWVFLGDYVDHWTLPNVDILHNLKEVIRFKKNNMSKVELLIGNHDFQYMYGNMSDYSYICSGFRPEAYWDLYNEFSTNEALFKMAHIEKNYLFTHAGVTMAWLKKWQNHLDAIYKQYNIGEDDSICNVKIDELLNFAQLVNRGRDMLWEVGVKRGGMRGDEGSPIWADAQESRFGVIRGYNHVVGHTPLKLVKKYKVDDNTTITYCDCLDKIDALLVIDIKEDKIEETII